MPAGADCITLLSIGSGDLREQRPRDTEKDLGIFTAYKSMPNSLLYCSVREQDLLCRTFGRCVTGERIDEEIGDLIGQSPGATPPMFTYHRVNVALTPEGLASIGCSGIGAAAVRPMDAVDQLAAFTEIGAALAATRLEAYLAD